MTQNKYKMNLCDEYELMDLKWVINRVMSRLISMIQ